MLNVVFWLIFGFLIGWIGAVLVANDTAVSLKMVLGGILGAMLGGSSAQVIGSGQILLSHSDPTSIIAAVFGAIALVGLFHLTTNQTSSG